MVTDESLDRVRRFERFYDRHLRRCATAVAMEYFSPAATRLLHELGLLPTGRCNAWLCARLQLDSGYLSRVLGGLEECGLVSSSASREDGRRREWNLTDAGRLLADRIEREYRSRVEEMLVFLAPGDQDRLVGAMRTVEEVLARHPLWRDF